MCASSERHTLRVAVSAALVAIIQIDRSVQIFAPRFTTKGSTLGTSGPKMAAPPQVVLTVSLTLSSVRTPSGLVFASSEGMTETTTDIPSRGTLANQPPGARRVSSTERALQPVRSAPEPHTLTEIQTLERRPTTLTRQAPAVSTLLVRIRSEYREMPGLKLTEAQARRLWGLDGDTCSLVLSELLEQRFLKYTPRGTYVRASD